MRTKSWSWACVAVLFIVAFPAMAVAQVIEFSGVKTHDDSGVYTYHEFTVPEGTTKIYFQYSYSPADLTGDSEWFVDPATGEKLGNVIDIGVFDPDGYRGWSGSNKHSFTIANSAEHTSLSYIPGAIQPGTWQVELGVGLIDDGGSLAYTVTITLSTEDVGEPYTPPSFDPVVISDQPGWYKGDLHCHSTHSDGGYALDVVYDYAESRGLDFLAVTDHNAISQLFVLPDMQEDYPNMLLIPGIEATAYNGHFNVYNYIGYVPYQGTAPDYDINEVIDTIHAAGGYMSPNHPAVPNLPFEDYSIGLGWGFPDTDWAKVDFMEIINGPMIVFDWIPNPPNLLAVKWWDKIQNAGHGMTARGGSDDHAAGHGGGTIPAYIGQPTTVVYAEELSAAAILEGIAQGHCFVIASGPDGPELYLTASNGKEEAIMGDTIVGETVQLTAHVVGGKGTRLHVLEDGRLLDGHESIRVTKDNFTYTIDLTPTEDARYRLELWQGLELLAITNSLYVEPAPVDDDTTDDDTTDDDTADDDQVDDDQVDDDAVDDDAIDDDQADDDIAADDDVADDDDDVSDDDDDNDDGCGCN